MSNLQVELDFFNQREPQFIKEGHFGQYVAITDHEILGFWENRNELVKDLTIRFSNHRPASLLIRQVLGEQRRPVRMMSPKIVRIAELSA